MTTASASPVPGLLPGIVQALPEALVVVDLQQRIVLWNPAAERLFGYVEAEVLGAELNLIVPERFRAAHDAGFARAVASGELRVAGRVMRTRAQPKDGRKLYVDFSFALVKDAQGLVAGVLATARDATEVQLKAAAG
ncbi:MAG: PAS domain S-box protein [Burkholderiales bacterium]|nr:PAS domain S-box protein [Burkholderiales bacterium]